MRAIKEAHLLLLQAALAADVDTTRAEGIAIALRRYALWLEDAALDGGEMLQAESDSALNLASSLYEFAGALSLSTPPSTASIDETPRTIYEPPLNDLLRAALVGSLTDYGAQAAYLARGLSERLGTFVALSPTEEAHALVARIIVSFLGHHFGETVTLGGRLSALLPDVTRDLKARDAANKEVYETDRAIALGYACRTAAASMLVGTAPMATAAVRAFERIVDAARDSEDPRRYWLARRLRRVTDHMHKASMHRILAGAGIPTTYRVALARDGIYELWKPQIEAIEAGLLRADEQRNYVLALPTGGGKSLIAELAILNALRSSPSTWALYITPSRALVAQASADLRRHLADSGITVRTVVAGAEQTVLLGEELDALAQRRSVTVTTPEKCDAYYRNAPDLFDTCALVIFDEVHKVGDADRGALLESLIARFLVQHPRTRLLLMSGSASNHEELVQWLGSEATTAIVASRRPTRQIRGVAVRARTMPAVQRTTASGTTRRVEFEGGLVIVHEREDLDGHISVDLPDVFDGYYTEKLYARSWREERDKRSSMNQHAVQIARMFSRAPGTTLVFVQQTQWAESCCDQLDYPDDGLFAAEREALARFLAEQLGPGHKLVQHCRRGVAYHHGRLPNSVQRAVELGLQRGWLKVVFATSTLREGLNTAVTNVILAGDTYSDDVDGQRRQVPVPEVDFEQLAGRAGRPFRETEGRVILVPNSGSLAQAKALAVGKKYMLLGGEALRAMSQLQRLAAWLERNDGALTDLPESEQSLLLGIFAAGLADEENVSSFFAQSLWAVQQGDDARVDDAISACAHLFARTEKAVGRDRLHLAARTGFSLSSTERMREVLGKYVDFFRYDPLRGDDTPNMLSALLEAALQAREVHKGDLRKEVSWEAHLAPLRAWIQARSYVGIASVTHTSGVLAHADDIGSVVKYCADLSTWLSWAFGACYTILTSIVEDVDPWVGTLPLLVKYGVSSLAAAYISLLGLSDRAWAQALGDLFETTGRPVSLSEVAAWTSEFGRQIEQHYPGDDLRGELAQQVFGGQRQQLPYMLASARVTTPLPVGHFVELHNHGDENITVIDRRMGQIGEIESTARVVAFVGGSPTPAIGFTIGLVSDGKVRVALVRPP